jgi:hypothetical protein
MSNVLPIREGRWGLPPQEVLSDERAASSSAADDEELHEDP